MAISYPLSLPSSPDFSRLVPTADSMVGVSRSPFTFEQQIYAHDGDTWEWQVAVPPMEQSEAEDWIALLLSLNGMEGTFLMGDPKGATPRGTWLGGSPTICVNGAHAAGVKTVALKNFTSGATGAVGDYIQFGTGSTTHLHKLVQAFTASGSGTGSIEIWPRLRAALADGDTFTVTSAKGLWRLASNRRSWDIHDAIQYGVSFGAIEAL